MWPFKQTKGLTLETWPIVRTKPVTKTYGRSISLFINNWHCHLATVDVYQDGSIDCWGFVDRALFKEKIQSQWVVPSPKADQILSVFNFGATGVADGNWWQTKQNIIREVESIIHAQNPKMQDLLNLHGSDTEVRGKVRYAKLGLSDKKPYRRDDVGEQDIVGDSVPVLRVNEGAFVLTRIVVYADGLCQVGSDEDFLSVDKVASLFDDGQFSNKAPVGSKIVLPGLGEFRTTTEFGDITVHDRIGELWDKLNVLNGKQSVVATCADLFEDYERDPSPQAKDALRKAYDAVPDHLRCYCGDMDTRDNDIRRVLYGEDD